MGIASLALGIIAIVIAIFVPAIGWAAALVALVGVILAAIARKKGANGVATAGLVISIIALAWGILGYLACVACLNAAGDAVDEAAKEISNLN